MRAILAIILVLFIPITVIADESDVLFESFFAERLTRDDKMLLQRALAFEGHYNALVDGKWGNGSAKALTAYSRKEFNETPKNWHIAALWISYLDRYERSGWAQHYPKDFAVSFLFPFEAFDVGGSNGSYANFEHTKSSLRYSLDISGDEEVIKLHRFAAKTHASRREFYQVVKDDFAVSAAQQKDGKLLYIRSNFRSGYWSTVILSAEQRDENILNAVAGSIARQSFRSLDFENTQFADYIIPIFVDFLNGAPSETAKVAAAPKDTHKSVVPDNSPKSGGSATGTGFVVSELGHILTNAHVVDGCKTITVNGISVDLVDMDKNLDLALLQAAELPVDKVAVFSERPAPLNTDVTVVGYPLSQILSGLNVTRGVVSSKQGLAGDVTQMQITAAVQSGNSGGPVLNSEGRVVGVVVAKLNAQKIADATGEIPQNINFAIRSELAKLFLFQNNLEPTLDFSQSTTPSPERIAADAERYTKLIECAL